MTTVVGRLFDLPEGIAVGGGFTMDLRFPAVQGKIDLYPTCRSADIYLLQL